MYDKNHWAQRTTRDKSHTHEDKAAVRYIGLVCYQIRIFQSLLNHNHRHHRQQETDLELRSRRVHFDLDLIVPLYKRSGKNSNLS